MVRRLKVIDLESSMDDCLGKLSESLLDHLKLDLNIKNNANFEQSNIEFLKRNINEFPYFARTKVIGTF